MSDTSLFPLVEIRGLTKVYVRGKQRIIKARNADDVVRAVERRLRGSTNQTTKKTTAQVAKPKKVEKVQSTEVASKPNTNPFNSL
jgi:hypothetical protein